MVKGERIMAVPEGVITTTDILQAEVVPEVVPVEEELPEAEADDLPELQE
jgi:hypothetical protein